MEEALTASVQETLVAFAEISLMAALGKPILLMENTVFRQGFDCLDPSLMKCFIIPVTERKDFRKDGMVGHSYVSHF